jgi:hypothetical protein
MMESERIVGVPLFLESTQPGQLSGRVQYLIFFVSVSVVDVNLRRVQSRCLLKRCAPLFAELVDDLLVFGVIPGVIEETRKGQSVVTSRLKWGIGKHIQMCSDVAPRVS